MIRLGLMFFGFVIAVRVFLGAIQIAFTPQGFAILLMASGLTFVGGFLVSGIRHGEWHRAWQGGLDGLILPGKWLFRFAKWLAEIAFGAIKGIGR